MSVWVKMMSWTNVSSCIHQCKQGNFFIRSISLTPPIYASNSVFSTLQQTVTQPGNSCRIFCCFSKLSQTAHMMSAGHGCIIGNVGFTWLWSNTHSYTFIGLFLWPTILCLTGDKYVTWTELLSKLSGVLVLQGDNLSNNIQISYSWQRWMN